MTQATDNEDEKWLKALAGNPDPGASHPVNQQAEALRRALRVRKDLLDAQVPKADAAQYEQLMFRLRREGLAGSPSRWSNPRLWGLVATVVLGVGVVIQMGGLYPGRDDADILRGGGLSTVLIVQEPELRLVELLAGIKAAGENPTVKREPDGRIVMSVKGTQKVLDYLNGQRIEPTLDQGNVTIELRPVAPKN
jgi:hypothetical protein